jgi:hypothetical protein
MSFMAAFLGILLAYGVSHAEVIIGFFMPVLVGYLNKDVPDSRARLLVAVFACFIAAGFLDWHKIAYGDPQAAFDSMGVIFLECETMYRLYFKNSLILQKIQGRTP